MKTMPVLWVALILALGLSLPTHAQAGNVNVEFRLAVTGAPCPNATYWAAYGRPASEFVFLQLMDPDGDGVYTGSIQVGGGEQLVIRLIQGTGTRQSVIGGGGPVPGEPSSIIRDFGLVTITGDMVFEGNVAGCPAGLPDTGASDRLPVVPIAGGSLLLASGAYLRRRLMQHA